MASISRDPGGRKRVLFVGPDKKRKTIRLGKVPGRAAEAIKVKVEALMASKVSGCPWDNETARWAAELPDEMADKLAAAGLIPEREKATLAAFVDSYIEKRIDVKGDTKVVWGHTKRNLLAFFGENKVLCGITPGDAEDFRLYLVGQGLSATTIHKRMQVARMFFRVAVKHGLIDRNPLKGVKAPAGDASDRFFFVTREMTDKVLATCPDYEWRLIVVLCRYGGLRYPSEVLSLRWDCIDWERQRIKVISPKTIHHPNRGSRVIPMFPELRPLLEEAFEQAREGAVYLINRYREGVDAPAGWRNINLRTQFEWIIDRAGPVASAVPCVAGKPGDGACAGVPRPVRHGLAGQHPENRAEALPDGDGGTLREGHNRRRRGGAKCGAVRARTGR